LLNQRKKNALAYKLIRNELNMPQVIVTAFLKQVCAIMVGGITQQTFSVDYFTVCHATLHPVSL